VYIALGLETQAECQQQLNIRRRRSQGSNGVNWSAHVGGNSSEESRSPR
jgi:hypothetical protein